MEGLGRAEFPTRPRSNKWAKQNCVLNRPMLKTGSFNLPNRRHPALENLSGSSGSSGLSHSWEFFPPHRTLSLPAFCFRTTRYIRPRRESRKSFFSHVLQFNDQQYAPTYKYTPSLLFVPRHLISHSPSPLPPHTPSTGFYPQTSHNHELPRGPLRLALFFPARHVRGRA